MIICVTGQHGHGTAQWNRIKSFVILLVSVVLMSLCADVVTFNIEPLLGGGVSVVSLAFES
jgi:Ca2+/H+ antiporter